MLSFFLCVDPQAEASVRPHASMIQRCLRERSWREHDDLIQAGARTWFTASGDETNVYRGVRWHLAYVPLTRNAIPTAQREAIARRHHALQSLAPSQVSAAITHDALTSTSDAAWIVWSDDDGYAFAYRDRFGKIPLYVYSTGTGFLITNTRLALEPWVQDAPVASTEVLASFLWQGMPPTTHATFFQRLSRVDPGGYVAICDPPAAQYATWWRWEDPPICTRSHNDATVAYRACLTASIERSLTSSTAVFELSGGIDSTGLAAAFRHRYPARSAHALSLTADEHDTDRLLARELAQTLAMPFHAHALGQEPTSPAPDPGTSGVLQEMAKILEGIDRPVQVFSGQGGDALFQLKRADMDRMRHDLSPAQWLRCIQQHRRVHGKLPPFFLRERLYGATKASATQPYDIPWLDSSLNEAIRQVQKETYARMRETSGRSSLFTSPKWTGIFEMTDAGFHGRRVQYHFPYFDLSLLRLVGSVPPIPYLYNKHLARQSWIDTLPPSIYDRPKTVYAPKRRALPAHTWHELAPLCTDIPWLATDVWRRALENPTAFPTWTHIYLRSTLHLIRWASHTDPARLVPSSS